jgi:hypothetical protein
MAGSARPLVEQVRAKTSRLQSRSAVDDIICSMFAVVADRARRPMTSELADTAPEPHLNDQDNPIGSA